MLNCSIYLTNWFFQMVPIIFMRAATVLVALNLLPRTSWFCKAKVLSLHFLNAENRKLAKQYCCSIFRKVKQLILKFKQLFAETLASYILETKVIFVNPDEHNINFHLQIYNSWIKHQDLWYTNVEKGVTLVRRLFVVDNKYT